MTDQPTNEDLLVREDIKNSITALLLNQHTGSPITLGILGGTGMGKSSMMLQVEHNLLSRAAHETIMRALPQSSTDPASTNKFFTGCKKESTQSRHYARRLLHELHQVVKEIEINKRIDKSERKAFDLEELNDLERYEERRWCKYWDTLLQFIFKQFRTIRSRIISILEFEVLLEDKIEEKAKDYILNLTEENKWLVKRLALASDGEEVPALMTIRVDAWQYEDKDEAWAGLAIAILGEMERSMPKAKLLRASMLYSIKTNPSYARMNLMFPIIAYLILGGIVGLISYILLSIPSSPYSKTLKYGSILVSSFLSIWKVLIEISKYAKPISDKLRESTKSVQMQHLSRAGYQHQVMEDINFLRDCMTSQNIPMLFLWKAFAFILNISSGSTTTSSVEASDALKNLPLREHFRIIVFIDNLDRHKEKLFTPLNMILKSCDINAVVAMDKESIEDVYEKEEDESGGNSKSHDQKITDTLLKQLIQIPITLPEPSIDDLNNTFLKHHLKDTRKKKRKLGHEANSSQNTKGTPYGNVDSTSLSTQHDMHVEHPGIQEIKEHPPLHQVERTSKGGYISEIQEIKEHPPLHQVERTSKEIDIHEIIKHQTLHQAAQPSIDTVQENMEDEDFQEDEESKKKKFDDKQNDAWIKMKLNVLDSNYSRGEIEVFKHFSKHTYGYYRSPRAWKSLLNYHRLIRSLLSYNKETFEIKAWRRQLVIWVFLCWQWKDQMDEIFKNWETLSYFNLEELDDNILVELQDREMLKKVLRNDYQLKLLKRKKYAHLWDHINFLYPTLLSIVDKHFNKAKKKGEGIESNDDKSKKNGITKDEKSDEQIRNTESSNSSLSTSTCVQSQTHHMKEKQELAKEMEIDNNVQSWERLYKALQHGTYDVNMQCIQAFQKHRFDCKPRLLKMCIHDPTSDY